LIWPPPDKPLEGKLVRLEPARPEHRDELVAVSREPESWEWMNRTIPADEAEFDSWFRERLAAKERREEWCLVTRSLASGAPIGSSSYLAVRPPHDGLEIGWTWLHPSAWRTGANREAKLLMLGFAFDELGCMRVEFKTDARNGRSRTALEGIGATYEGTFRKHMLMPGVGVRDSAYFSITDDDWAEVRERLRAGLRSRGEATSATA
jgi:RimJ/RimL family protein N-acetyltransferase